MSSRAELREGESAEDGLLKCVWRGYPDQEQSCECCIPHTVVATTWLSQTEHENERFFCVPWKGGTWLAYGLRDGEVRGVYCPTHCAEREARAPNKERLTQLRLSYA